MDKNIRAIETSIAFTRRCLPLFNGNAPLKLQLEDKIFRFEKLRNQLLYACLIAIIRPSTVVSVVPLFPAVDPLPPPSHTVGAASSVTVISTTGTAIASTNTSADTIQAPQKYPQYILV